MDALYKTISQWNEEDRPREKLVLRGKQHLSDAELLAIIIGSGTPKVTAVDLCREILSYANNDLVELGKLSVKDLMKFKGIGEAKAISIVAALELGRRRQADNVHKIEKITCSRDAYRILLSHLADLYYEEFWIIYLNKQNKVIGKEKISAGGIAGTVADIRIIFKSAVDRLATGILLAHNHPSGNLNPSDQDIELTRKLNEAGKVLDIQVVDHLIISHSGYYSFADEGKL
jgi:DNA repair protein RadC